MSNYATIADLEVRWKTLTESERTTAEVLLSEASAKIRRKAKAIGKDFDQMIVADADLAEVAKGVVCSAVKMAMNTPIELEGMSQMSMTAGGYSWSGTYSNPSGGIRLSKNDFKAIGLGSQLYGGLDVYGLGNCNQ